MTQPLLFLATLVSDPAFAGDVLLLTSWPGDLLQRQGEMVDMGVFGTIDRLDTTLSTPSLADLLAYDAVLLVNGHIPHDAEPLGKDAIGRDPHKPDPTRPDPLPTPLPASPLEASAIILELLRQGYEHRHDAIELLLTGPMRCVLDKVEAPARIEDRRALNGGARCRQVVPPLVAGRVLPRAFCDIEYDRQGGA